MRIAVYYDNRIVGRDDGPPLYYKKTLQDLGHNVDMMIPAGDLTLHGKYDLNLWVDWGEDCLKAAIPYQLIDCPHPNVYITSDTHVGYDYRMNLAKKFDLVLVNQVDGLERFKADGVRNAHFHPHAFHPLAYNQGSFDHETGWKSCAVLKRFDVCFVGHANSPERVEFLDAMFKEFPNFFYGQKLFDAAATVFNESKIVLNQALNNDINMRVFEALACRRALVTDRTPELEAMGLIDGEHYVGYDSTEELVKQVRELLADEPRREKIANAGHAWLLAAHTYAHRVEEMKKDIEALRIVKLGGERTLEGEHQSTQEVRVATPV